MSPEWKRRPNAPVLIANGGAELYGSDRMLLETVEGLVAHGERVIVTLPVSGPLVEEIVKRGGTVVLRRTPILRKAILHPKGFVIFVRDATASILPSLALLRKYRPRALIVNTVTPLMWLLLGRVAGVAVICHVHEGEASASRFVRAGLAAPLLLADRLIVNSRYSWGVLIRAIPRLSRRATVIYNAVAGPSRELCPRSTLSGPTRLLYVGRLSPRKGPDIAIRAVDLLVQRGVDVTLDLVGAVFPGYEWFEQQLRDQVVQAGLERRVCFHGFQRDVWSYAMTSDINLIPSTIDEPFGNTAVEAALSARPSIVSRTSGLIEASSGFRSAILVTPGSAEEIAVAVETIRMEWPEYVERARGDAQDARTRYGRDSYRSAINQVLSDVSK